MPAYVIAEVNVTDPKLYDEYRKIVPALAIHHKAASAKLILVEGA